MLRCETNVGASRSPREGFTLLEVLVATALMGTVIVSLLSLISTSMGNARRAEAANRALTLGRSTLQELIVAGSQATGATRLPLLRMGERVSGQWDNLARWEVTVTPSEPIDVDGNSATVPVNILFTVYWRREVSSRENSFVLETSRLWNKDIQVVSR